MLQAVMHVQAGICGLCHIHGGNVHSTHWITSLLTIGKVGVSNSKDCHQHMLLSSGTCYDDVLLSGHLQRRCTLVYLLTTRQNYSLTYWQSDVVNLEHCFRDINDDSNGMLEVLGHGSGHHPR